MVRRVVFASLIIVVVSAAFLGFASGDLVSHVWDKHPRHAGAQHLSPPHVAWKTTPAVAPLVVAVAQPPRAGTVAPLVLGAVIGAAPRPPFVPPRV